MKSDKQNQVLAFQVKFSCCSYVLCWYCFTFSNNERCVVCHITCDRSKQVIGKEEDNASHTIQGARSRDGLAARVSCDPTDKRNLCVNRANKTVSNTVQTKYAVGTQFHIIVCYYLIPLVSSMDFDFELNVSALIQFISHRLQRMSHFLHVLCHVEFVYKNISIYWMIYGITNDGDKYLFTRNINDTICSKAFV